jgi:ATP-dependent DNA helicase RecQ
MLDFCSGVQCRHRAIVEYFGQQLDGSSCDACDVCLGQLDLVDDALTVGQKILSCVMRLQQRFGGDYTAKVLNGSKDQRIVQQGHDRLSTWGLLADENLRTIRDWIEQLVSQEFLAKLGEYNTLQVTPAGWQLLKGEGTPRLLRPAKRSKAGKPARARAEEDSWEGVDRGLFAELRRLRHEKAAAQNVPAYIVFGDAALRDMARRRPSTLPGFRQVKGVGDKKLADYGHEFVEHIAAYCRANSLPMDMPPPGLPAPRLAAPLAPPEPPSEPGSAAQAAFPLFRQGLSLEQIAQRLGRAPSTVRGYLALYIRQEQITEASPWVDAATARRVSAAARQVGAGPLKDIFDLLGGQVSFEQIRIVLLCLSNRDSPLPAA